MLHFSCLVSPGSLPDQGEWALCKSNTSRGEGKKRRASGTGRYRCSRLRLSSQPLPRLCQPAELQSRVRQPRKQATPLATPPAICRLRPSPDPVEHSKRQAYDLKEPN